MIDKLAWLHVAGGRVLSTRSAGKDVYYLPGGKREPGESDADALCREIREELSVELDRDSLELAGVFEAQAHGHGAGVLVRMTCYRARFTGELAAANEIAEVVWLDYGGREWSSPVDRIIFDWLRERGEVQG